MAAKITIKLFPALGFFVFPGMVVVVGPAVKGMADFGAHFCGKVFSS
jgi:hypothetical protein